MRISVLGCCAAWALLLRICHATEKPPTRGLIRPGVGVSRVELGADFSSFEAVFPRQPRFDEDEPGTFCGAGRVYHWLDMDRRATGVYAYLKNDAIYQLSVQTPRFSLSNGIKVNASERKVKEAYPHGRAYVLLHSGSVAMGGRDLTYWVDQEQGVAFELSWYRDKKQRFVRAIDVFQRGADYRPEGCISPPREWRALARTLGQNNRHCQPGLEILTLISKGFVDRSGLAQDSI